MCAKYPTTLTSADSVPIGFVGVAEVVVIRDRAIEGVEFLPAVVKGHEQCNA